MYIDTYINSSDNNKINKNITAVASSVSVTCYDDTNMINPRLIVSAAEDNFNYCYISDFNRYYFVTDKTISQGRVYLQLKVDPLLSFASEIEDLGVILARSTDHYDLFLPDSDYPVRSDKLIQVEQFSNGFGGEQFVLAVTGGYQTP